jgi:hypothetical protein
MAGEGGREKIWRESNIQPFNTRPTHPQTPGKIRKSSQISDTGYISVVRNIAKIA